MGSFDFDQFKKRLLDNDIEKILSDSNELVIDQDVARSLSNVFMFLSFAFRYPTEDVYNEVFANFKEFELFFTEYLKKVPELPFLEDIESEYVSLFVARQGGTPAAPYASLYTENEKLLMRDSTIALKELMLSAGFQIGEETKDVEDNLYIMLEFISSILNQIAVVQSCQKELVERLSVIMIVWVNYIGAMATEFSEKIEEYAGLPFYKDMSELLKLFMADCDNLCVELIDVKGAE